MNIAQEIIDEYKNVSHREAFCIAKEKGLNDQQAMWVADDVYKILNPIPVTKMENWRKETWKREDFKKLKELILKHEEAEAFTCYSNQQLILIHIKINDKKSYREVLDMLKTFRNFEYDIWGRKARAIELSYYDVTHHLEEEFKKIDEDLDKFFVFSNGNSKYLVSTSEFTKIQKANFEEEIS